MNSDSILDSTKKALGLAPEYDAFDPDIVMHINSVFFALGQLGIGPDAGFTIQDEHDEWGTFLENAPMLSSVKTYVYLRVRLLFDPPSTSFHLQAIEKQIQEIEWRLLIGRDELTASSSGVITPVLEPADGGET